MKKLYRSTRDRYVAGVLGGIAEYLNMDSTVVRVIFIIALFFSLFSFALLYIILAFLIPEDTGIY